MFIVILESIILDVVHTVVSWNDLLKIEPLLLRVNNNAYRFPQKSQEDTVQLA